MISLSVIIPAFNEESEIVYAIQENLRILDSYSLIYEIIIINDGSNDKTKSIVRNFVIDNNRVKLFNKSNGGFGSAIKLGIEKSKYEFILCIPVDGPLTNKIFNPFYSSFEFFDVLIGYREERNGYTTRMLFNSWFYHKIISFLFGMKLKDYNWIHGYRKSIFKHIEIEYSGIFMLAEILIKAEGKKFIIKEIPVNMPKRRAGIATASSWAAAWKTLTDTFSFYFKTK